jgi:Replication-relaxation
MRDSSARSYLSARGLAYLRERLSDRDRAIIEQVAELRLMSARQIQAIHFPSDEHANELAATRARQRVLTRLRRDRLLIALQRRVGGVRAGSGGLVVALGPVGQRVRAVGGRRRSHEPGLHFFEHTLAISQLVVDLTVAARIGALELLSVQAEPACWRQVADLRGRRWLRPDAFLVLGANGYELRWFCEVDQATESIPTVLGKCRLYVAYRQSGREQANGGGVFPRVCWITPDETRATAIREAIAADRQLPDRLFMVTTAAQAVTALCSVS